MAGPTKSQLKKAGSRIRRFYRGEASLRDLDDAIRDIESYRAQFAKPLRAMNMALRRYVRQAEVSAQVTQRLKKVPTIIDKISARETALNLTTMHDIGGCRAVVEDLEALNQLLRVILERNPHRIIKHRDYVTDPRASGYRAHHLIFETSNTLPVEVQLRTRSMHIWAETVEGFSHDLHMNLKQDGEGVMFEFLKVVAEIYWCRESGAPVTDELRTLYNELLVEAKDFMKKQML